MTGSLPVLCLTTFSGAKGSEAGDLVDVATVDVDLAESGVSWKFRRGATVAGVAGYPDRMRGVALIAFRVCNEASDDGVNRGVRGVVMCRNACLSMGN